MPVKIHNKEYVTVAERVAALHEARNGEAVSIETWIAHEDDASVTIGAKVLTPAGSFTGHARSSKTAKSIEGQSPLEVAETSAVGRALGFAGLGVIDSIASADEVQSAPQRAVRPITSQPPEIHPSTVALRALYAEAKDHGLDEAGLKAFLQTDSLKALAEHMMEPKGDCEMGHTHNLPSMAEAYRTFTRWVKNAPEVVK